MNILSFAQLPTDTKKKITCFIAEERVCGFFSVFFLQEKKRNESAIVTTLLPTVKKKGVCR
jgi:hypothetical protein